MEIVTKIAPIALALIMLGLGLGLSIKDFTRVLKVPKDVYFRHTGIMSSHINVGSGEETSIKDLALLIRDIIKFKGDIVFDKSKPDGTPRKLMDSARIFEMGWQPKINLEEGLRNTIGWYTENIHVVRR